MVATGSRVATGRIALDEDSSDGESDTTSDSASEDDDHPQSIEGTVTVGAVQREAKSQRTITQEALRIWSFA
jgi:hypothetical protein